MLFIILCRAKVKPTKEATAESTKLGEGLAKAGTKILATYWTLGRYDTVLIMEAKDEKAAMKAAIDMSDFSSTETLVAVPREEALKLLE